jgi:hypothetical protein
VLENVNFEDPEGEGTIALRWNSGISVMKTKGRWCVVVLLRMFFVRISVSVVDIPILNDVLA